jgi:hypothetical protein
MPDGATRTPGATDARLIPAATPLEGLVPIRSALNQLIDLFGLVGGVQGGISPDSTPQQQATEAMENFAAQMEGPAARLAHLEQVSRKWQESHVHENPAYDAHGPASAHRAGPPSAVGWQQPLHVPSSSQSKTLKDELRDFEGKSGFEVWQKQLEYSLQGCPALASQQVSAIMKTKIVGMAATTAASLAEWSDPSIEHTALLRALAPLF